MKIITRKEFLKMPPGTLFSYYHPCAFNGLAIKEDTIDSGCSGDFNYTNLIGEIDNTSSDDFQNKCEAMEKGVSVPMDFNCTMREGLFNTKQLFAIYEKEDVLKLIKRLKETLD